MAEPITLKYRAFISYSHADASWAKWLHRGLESFRIDKDLVGRETATGTIPKALRPIFRDRDDFTAGHSLTDQTLAALDASAALIVICSPDSAKSEYVTEEIRLYKSRHPERPVIPLIVAGTPGDAELECFPPALKFKLDAAGDITDEPVEVLAADAREQGDGKQLALAKLVAGLLGVSSDEIYRRAERDRRRKGRVRYAIFASVAFLSAVGAYATWDSFRKGGTIAEQQQEKSEALAIARRLLRINPAAAAVPGQEQNLVAALTAIEEGAAKGDADYIKAFELLKKGKETEAVPLLLAAAEEKKRRGAKENREAAKAYREVAAIAGISDLRKARQYYAEAAKLDPDDLDGMLQHGMFQLVAGGSLDEGEAVLRKVVAKAESQKDDRHLFFAHVGIGTVRMIRGDLSTAVAEFSATSQIAKRLIEADPDDPLWQGALAGSHGSLGAVLRKQGKLEEALEAYRDSLAIFDRLAKADANNPVWQGNQAGAYQGVGDVLMAQGSFAQALTAYRDGLTILDHLTEADPNNDAWQMLQAMTYRTIGDVLKEQGDPAGALESYRNSVTVFGQLAEADPDNALLQDGLGGNYLAIGNVLESQGDFAGALGFYQKTLAIFDRLAKADPGNALWQRGFAASYEKVGDVLKAQEKFAEALVAFRNEIAVFDQLPKADPSNGNWQRGLPYAFEMIGDIHRTQGNLADALQSYRTCLVYRMRLATANPSNLDLQRDVAVAHWRIAQTLGQQGDGAEALAEFRQARAIVVRAMEASPDKARLQRNLAWLDGQIAELKQTGLAPAAAQAAQ